MLNIEYSSSEKEIPSFEIIAYIISEEMISTLSKQNYNYKPTTNLFHGYYDKGSRIGKLLIKKEEITRNIDSMNTNYYLYIIMKKVDDSNIIYTKVEGQFSFVEMNYRYRYIPEGFYIFNKLLPGLQYPHLYTILMDPTPGKYTRIEFAASGKELNCKILKYSNYIIGSEDLFSDYNDYEIRRESRLGKTYIYVKQSNDINNLIKEIIVSIFSSNIEDNEALNSDFSLLEYSLRYSRESDYGLYDYQDINGNKFDFTLIKNELNPENIEIKFYHLKSKKSGDENYIS